MLFKHYSKSSPLNSTHYAMLYPQNGDRIVAIDSVTLLHPVCSIRRIKLKNNPATNILQLCVKTLIGFKKSCHSDSGFWSILFTCSYYILPTYRTLTFIAARRLWSSICLCVRPSDGLSVCLSCISVYLIDAICIVCTTESMQRSGVRPSVRLFAPSIDSSSGGRQVCCWAPCRKTMWIASSERRAAGAGAQQQMRVTSHWRRLNTDILCPCRMGRLSDTAIRPSVCPSVCPSPGYSTLATGAAA